MILVTGGAGFIGSNFIHLAQKLNQEDILCLDALTYSGTEENFKGLPFPDKFKFVKGDIRDEKLVPELLKKYHPKALIHFAAESHVDRSITSPKAFLETNILGTANLLSSALDYFKSGLANEFRFVHISTDEVFGSLNINDPPFTEETKYAPNSPYSASKASADHLVRAYHHTYGLPVLTVNCSNNYGPRQFPEKLIPLMIKNALSGQKLPIYGTGTNIRDWLFVEDFCRAILQVTAQGKLGETYNVGGGHELSNLEVVNHLCSLLDKLKPKSDGTSYSAQKQFVTDRLGHDFRYSVSFKKLQTELGWAPQESFETGLRKTVQWYLKNHG